MNTENRIFTTARLGRKWTTAAAAECLAFFGSPYQFDWRREREFATTHATDYEVSGYNLLDRIRSADNAAHGIHTVFDNGGATCDRYTLYLPEFHDRGETLRSCLCLSDHPEHPQAGFSQFSSGWPGLHNGSFIGFTELPENVQRHAIARLEIKIPQAA